MIFERKGKVGGQSKEARENAYGEMRKEPRKAKRGEKKGKQSKKGCVLTLAL
jgi:hypothetical protein